MNIVMKDQASTGAVYTVAAESEKLSENNGEVV